MVISSKHDAVLMASVMTMAGWVTTGFGHPDNYAFCSEEFCLPKDYHIAQPPFPVDGSPIKVGVDFDIFEITRINDKEFLVEVLMEMTVVWAEPRLWTPDKN